MPYRLRDSLFWCQCAGRLDFLDLVEDRYFCLAPDATAAFLGLVAGKAGSGELRHLRPLVARGMLVEDRTIEPQQESAGIPLASADFAAEHLPQSSLASKVQAVTEQLRWSFLLRARPLASVVERARRNAEEAGRAGEDASPGVGEIISAFAAVSGIFPSEGRCLVRALAFNSLCRRIGIRPSLVFGVRMNPFRAHCWVQLGGKVLIGDFEQVRLFTPIAAFE
jgi:hypothetical protein